MITSYHLSAGEYDNHRRPDNDHYGSGDGYRAHVWGGSGAGPGYDDGNGSGSGDAHYANLGYPRLTS